MTADCFKKLLRVASGFKENLLLFECRNSNDFIYREELEEWQKSGVLEMHVAFSRKEGVPKTYVQQLIEREEARVTELLKKGAHFYVCGDASKMAPDVQRAMARICEKAGLGGEAYVHRMAADGRYCQDVWAAQSV